MTTPRENIIRALKRQGFDYVPVDFVFCESQIKSFQEKFGHADYESYFGMCHRQIEMNIQRNYVNGPDLYRRESLPDSRLRKFLMKNLRKGDGDTYVWKINLPVLKKNLAVIADGIDLDKLSGSGISNYPALFVRGEDSDYINENDIRAIKNLFPLSNMVTLKNAGHWLHAEQPEMFSKVVKRFIIS